MKQPVIPFGIICISLLCLSCGKNPSPSADTPAFYRGHDLVGNEISLVRRPERIISLAPSNTEILFALGAGHKLVGITSVCDFPQATNAIQRLGDLGRINLEHIVSLKPDLVLASNKTDAEALAILGRLGIPAAVTEATTLKETFSSILEIGRMTGTADKAAILVKTMHSEIDTTVERVKESARRPLCYYVVGFGQGGNWTAGPGSFIHEMITLAGGRNAAENLGRPWGIFQLEKLLEIDPDIVLAGKHSGAPAQLKHEPGYRGLSAIKHNRLIIIDDDLVNRPGPRLVQGLRAMARALHPEIFSVEGNP